MFERNRIENPTSKRDKAVPVELVLDDDRVAKGRIHLSSARQLFDELNADGGFLDFEPYDGPRELVAKAALRAVRLADVPKSANLSARAAADFDPYAILDVPHGADWATVRDAYHRASKVYHPDRYAGADLPPEVAEYLDAMSRRVNAAFAALEKPMQVKRDIARTRTEPIYQRG